MTGPGKPGLAVDTSMTQDQRDTRRDYAGGPLRRDSLADDPFEQFERWFAAAQNAGVPDVTAMALATADAASVPSVRIVLLKHFTREGFCWYTDYRSAKGRDLDANPVASALFFWAELDRQVRITGHVERLPAGASREYFRTRPEDSRFSAAASVQSAPIADRASLEAAVAALRARHPDGEVEPPESWGGFRLEPVEYEFWQGREGRLHDRFRYSRSDAGWQLERLQP